MRAVVQRVSESSVETGGAVLGRIGLGINILLGIKSDDTMKDISYLAGKILRLRIFPDQDGKMNLSVQDVNGEILIISQFTLYGDCRKYNRPSYSDSAESETARVLYGKFVDYIKDNSNLRVETGVFQADMMVTIKNDGPVTLILDSR
ncbi:MAG: D-tyrosyl-tRNA(Tyr) deacylase [Clostridia bacterium]|nr:D-tyrosyl-tRNA(Tyr) deacylase [Clostridia bacterium]